MHNYLFSYGNRKFIVNSFIRSLYHIRKSLSVIRAVNGLKYFFYSGLIGGGILLLMYYVVSLTYDKISIIIDSFIPWDVSFLSAVSDIISVGFISVLFFIIYKHLVLILTAPIMSKLSERVENHVNGNVSQKDTTIIGELLRGARIAFRNLGREIGLSIIILIISLFPLFSLFSSPLLLVVQGYYAGFGNFDYWAERHLSFRGTIDFMKDHKVMITVNGLFFILLLAIPILGVIIAPPLATVAATLHAAETMEQLRD